jgi:hypothetical protein
MNNLKQYIKITWWRIKLFFKRPDKDGQFIYEDDDQ